MTAKDAFNSACEMLCYKYRQYGFKFTKSKKQIKGCVNGVEIYIDIETSRDNSSDYFVKFMPTARILKNGERVCCSKLPEHKDEKRLFGDNLIIDVSQNLKAIPEEYRKMLSDTIETRMWIGEYFHCWNVAYPEQQKKAAEEAAKWLDGYTFSEESAINAVGFKIVSCDL